ncbi:putative pectate lyase [Aeromonas phage CF8]|nr:putative pectate lyase [Aeromonas phage CF8]
MGFNTNNPLGSSDERDFYDNSANLDKALNSEAENWTDRLGVERPTVDYVLKQAGFTPAGFDFKTGGTLRAIDRNKCVFNQADQTWYMWQGDLPKTVAANSTPNPLGDNGWKPEAVDTGGKLRSDLLNGSLVMRNGLFAQRDFVSVRDFGVKGDGITDDTQAIQLAINFASSISGELIFPPGNYNFQGINFDGIRYTKVKGLGRVVLKYTGPENNSAIDCSDPRDTSGVIFENIQLDLNNVKNVKGFDLFYFTNQSALIDCGVINVSDGSVGLYLDRSWFAHFERFTVVGNNRSKTGIGVFFNSQLEAINGIVFNNIRVHSLGRGIKLKTGQFSCYGNSFIGGNIEQCGIGLEIEDLGGKEFNQLKFSEMYFENHDIHIKINCISVSGYISFDNSYHDFHTGFMDTSGNKTRVLLEECKYLSIKNTNGDLIGARNVTSSNVPNQDIENVIFSRYEDYVPVKSLTSGTNKNQNQNVQFYPVIVDRIQIPASPTTQSYKIPNKQIGVTVPSGGAVGRIEVFTYYSYGKVPRHALSYAVHKTSDNKYGLMLLSGQEVSSFSLTRDENTGELNFMINSGDTSYLQVVWHLF